MVTVYRMMGIENEYGIIDTHDVRANPMLMSTQLVTAYAYHTYGEWAGPRWDYAHEDPLQDARGFRLSRASAHPTLLTDVTDQPAPGLDADAGSNHRPVHPSMASGGPTAGLEPTTGQAADRLLVSTMPRSRSQAPVTRAVTNVITPNGARFYVDHAHPEYSGPEVTNPRDAVIWDAAGDREVAEAAGLLAEGDRMPRLALFKNNTDGKGASYGTHENYLVGRDVPFDSLASVLIPFLVTRPILCGAGRVGVGQSGQHGGFQISQRADFIENDIGLETTLARPIINTRDEPHSDAHRYRRLHVIVGDANISQISTFMKLGTTAIVLDLLENSAIPSDLQDLQLADPIEAAHQVSHDLGLRRPLELKGGERLTAIGIQRRFLDAALNHGSQDELTSQVLAWWAEILDGLLADPASVASKVEWVAKLQLLERLRQRRSLTWDAPELAALDIQWSQIDVPGLALKLQAQGMLDVLATSEQIESARREPPRDTRAYFRGRAIAQYGESVTSGNWDSVVLDVGEARDLYRLTTVNPGDMAADVSSELFDSHPDPKQLIRAFRRYGGPLGGEANKPD